MLQALVHNAVCRGFIKKTRYKSIISKVNTEELMIKDEVSKNGEHVLIT